MSITHTHAVSNTLYWSLAVIDLIFSHTALLQWCLTFILAGGAAIAMQSFSSAYVAIPWIGCIVCCPQLPDLQHVIWCCPLAWCSSVRLSPSLPHQLSTSPLDYSVWHCVACIFHECCQWLTVSVAEPIRKLVSDFCYQFHITKPEAAKPVTV